MYTKSFIFLQELGPNQVRYQPNKQAINHEQTRQINIKRWYIDCLPEPYATSPPPGIPSGVPETSGCWPDGQFDAVAENRNIILSDPPFIERRKWKNDIFMFFYLKIDQLRFWFLYKNDMRIYDTRTFLELKSLPKVNVFLLLLLTDNPSFDEVGVGAPLRLLNILNYFFNECWVKI